MEEDFKSDGNKVGKGRIKTAEMANGLFLPWQRRRRPKILTPRKLTPNTRTSHGLLLDLS